MFGVVLGVADRMAANRRLLEALTARHAVLFGFAQAMALVPRVEVLRSGGTISAGMMLGYTRQAAALYAFLLAIPAVLASGGLELTKIGHGPTPAWGPTLLATAVAFGVGTRSLPGSCGTPPPTGSPRSWRTASSPVWVCRPRRRRRPHARQLNSAMLIPPRRPDTALGPTTPLGTATAPSAGPGRQPFAAAPRTERVNHPRGAITVRAFMPGTAGIAAINAAVEALVKPLAVELAPIRINAISPGLVDTPWWSALPEPDRLAYFTSAAKALPARQIATADDIAEAIVPAVTNPNITGTVIATDGGA